MPKRLGDVCVGNHLNDASVATAQRGMVDGLSATRLAQMFRGMADPSRMRMLSVLRAGEVSVYDIACAVAMSQSAVSHQLATLRDVNLVRFRKDGRKVYYSLHDEHVTEILDLAIERAHDLAP